MKRCALWVYFRVKLIKPIAINGDDEDSTMHSKYKLQQKNDK